MRVNSRCSVLFSLNLLFMPLLPAMGSEGMQLPEVPYPAENPPTEAKRLLGKILFWDEQLSTDNSTACGSCHMPATGGADKRIGLGPGYDKKIGTKDDIRGSLGVLSRDQSGQRIKHPIFGNAVQITNRAAQSFFTGIWADSQFWDGRAQSELIDPTTLEIAIQQGGALENQSLGPLMSSVEMAKQGQTAIEVTRKLQQAKPLSLASGYPKDIADYLSQYPTYPTLFSRAFGDPEINLIRIAFAIATYERSLVANQTPWDKAMGNNRRLPYLQNLGWEFFKQKGCADCHKPPLFTDNKFYNIGIQGQNADIGQQLMTGNKADVGKMKTPSLRNVGLKLTFMHTGQFNNLDQVLDAYIDPPFDDITSKLPNGEDYNFDFTEHQRKAVKAFLNTSLTDPRVQSESFPFDRPRLRHEYSSGNPSQLTDLRIVLSPENKPIISWNPPSLKQGEDIEIVRNDGHHFWSTQTPFIDHSAEAGKYYYYHLSARNTQLVKSASVQLSISTEGSPSWVLWIFAGVCAAFLGYMIVRVINSKPI